VIGGSGFTPDGTPFQGLAGSTVIGSAATPSSACSPRTGTKPLAAVEPFTRLGRREDNVVVCMSRKLKNGTYEVYELLADGSFGVVRFCKSFDGALLWHETLMRGSTIRHSL
jgi:hypothetical protein